MLGVEVALFFRFEVVFPAGAGTAENSRSDEASSHFPTSPEPSTYIYIYIYGIFPKSGVLFWGPYNKDYSISGSIFGSPYFGETTIGSTSPQHKMNLLPT